ncbi:hypothetical protein V6N11_008548 [Hibiscus sabdariffa]|uniref:Uncharacterized protein n=2 Tax=Hibiscus sabdariffa TaxID=183260 RepID=A0ABR2PNQ4_9ROSI
MVLIVFNELLTKKYVELHIFAKKILVFSLRTTAQEKEPIDVVANQKTPQPDKGKASMHAENVQGKDHVHVDNGNKTNDDLIPPLASPTTIGKLVAKKRADKSGIT